MLPTRLSLFCLMLAEIAAFSSSPDRSLKSLSARYLSLSSLGVPIRPSVKAGETTGNAEKVVVSGNKETDKIYYHHTGYPGGLKSASVKEVREKDATKLIEKAVKGMLQHNTLGADQFNKLKVYCGPEHPHAAQKPVVLEKEAK